jgi:DNA polymerase III sliding clamp (beta) subunit (PCNA family)
MDNTQLQQIFTDPMAMVVPLPTEPYPEWQGMTLGAILEAHPGDGLGLLEFLANGYSGDFSLKLAASLMLAERLGWGPYAHGGNGKCRPAPRAKAAPAGLTGRLLDDALTILCKAVNRRVTLPVLHCICVQQTPESLVLSATDLETHLRLTLPFGASETWEAILDAKALAAAVKAAGAKPVALRRTADAVQIDGARSSALVPAPISVEEFPLLSEGQPVTIRGLDLGLLAAACTAAASDEKRPVLTTAYLDVARQAIVAADGFRLCVASVPLEADGELPHLLIPARSVKLASDTIAYIESANFLLVSKGSNALVLRGPAKAGGKAELRAILVDHSFPDHHQIIPNNKTVPMVFQVNVALALEAVNGLLPTTKGAARPTILEANEGVLRIRTSSAETGTRVAEVPILSQNGRTAWAVNARYVADALKALKGLGVETATFRVGPVGFDGKAYRVPGSPFIIEGGALKWVVMPMHPGRNTLMVWNDLEARMQHARELARDHDCPEELVEEIARRMVEEDAYDRESVIRIGDKVLRERGI